MQQLKENDKIKPNTVGTIHCCLHPTFQMAVRDEIIRSNPCNDAYHEMSAELGKNKGVRNALTINQQKAFMDFIDGHPVFDHWVPAFTVLLGTGCRCGEFIGLCWEDIDMENRMISINHALVRAARERREPELLPHFSCHYLRHTFCTRFCENETNLKVIQSVMGHKNIKTTMEIYAECTDEKKK